MSWTDTWSVRPYISSSLIFMSYLETILCTSPTAMISWVGIESDHSSSFIINWLIFVRPLCNDLQAFIGTISSHCFLSISLFFFFLFKFLNFSFFMFWETSTISLASLVSSFQGTYYAMFCMLYYEFAMYLERKKHFDWLIKWRHIPRYWPFVRGIHRSPVNSPHKGQWRGALVFSLIYAWLSGWVNYREAGDLRRHRAHYDVTVMLIANPKCHEKAKF